MERKKYEKVKGFLINVSFVFLFLEELGESMFFCGYFVNFDVGENIVL